MSLLTAWANFYVIVGSAAAALTGLMFVVITLIAGRGERRPLGEFVGVFGTPTVVHLATALLVAALVCAPWRVLWPAALLLGLTGMAGVSYMIFVVRRAHTRTSGYRMVLEDWLWHTIFPFVAYIALAVAALLLPGVPSFALFITGAVTMLFLFIGIHNAWDTVTYTVSNVPAPRARHPDETVES